MALVKEELMPARANRLTVLVLATLMTLAILLLGSIQQPASAACDPCSTPGATQDVYADCCINATRWDHQVCSSSCCWVHQSYFCRGTCML